MRSFSCLLVLLLAPSAFADTDPARVRVNNRCFQYTMCNAEADTGVCLDAGDSDEIVFHSGQWANYVFYSEKSTATDYSCDIFTNGQGFDADADNDQVNTDSITDEAPTYTMRVLLRYLWVNCSTIADNQVTIEMTVCPL